MCTLHLFFFPGKTLKKQIQISPLAQCFCANRIQPSFLRCKLFTCVQRPKIEPCCLLLTVLAKVLQPSPCSRETGTAIMLPEEGRTRSYSSSRSRHPSQSSAANTAATNAVGSLLQIQCNYVYLLLKRYHSKSAVSNSYIQSRKKESIRY